MLVIAASLAVVVCLLAVAESLWRHKVLGGENLRKFVHIAVGSFIAFWPWFMSWRTIQLIGVAMIIAVLVNRRWDYLHFLGNQRTRYFGDVFLPLAVILASLITDNEIFFAMAILHVALADGLAAVVGSNFGRRWRYTVFRHTYTVLGSMTFWLISLCILGVGVLLANGSVPYSNYVLLLLALPPALTLLENVSGLGLDNIIIPTAVILALNLASSSM